GGGVKNGIDGIEVGIFGNDGIGGMVNLGIVGIDGIGGIDPILGSVMLEYLDIWHAWLEIDNKEDITDSKEGWKRHLRMGSQDFPLTFSTKQWKQPVLPVSINEQTDTVWIPGLSMLSHVCNTGLDVL
ncbi:hypothetical protein HAX54_001340, partial [Datura stramonium]|nr:hypothetical protein [Datura stramonium]